MIPADASSVRAVPAPVASGVPLMELSQVSRRFRRPRHLAARIAGLLGSQAVDDVVTAVDRVDLTISKGEVVGIAGESGCGKSTLGRIIAGIGLPSEGKVHFKGTDVTRLRGKEARAQALAVQMIFQDPYAALNPRMRIADIVGEAPCVHGLVSAANLPRYVDDLLTRVKLDPGYKSRFPHQLSGGQRQRVNIARMLAVGPELLVCDEAVAALDVSIQAQIINLFIALRAELDLTYLFISHDLGVIEHLCDRVVIMYLGRIIEEAPVAELFKSPNHPYTRALLEDVPTIRSRQMAFNPIKGEIPSPLHPPAGCHFHPRCPLAMPICKQQAPALREVAPGRRSACHLNNRP